MDLVEILVRFPMPPTKGPGILTASGAYVGLTNDFAEEVGLELPRARAGHAEEGRARSCRPTATTAIRSTSPPASRRTRCPTVVKALIDDPNVGMLFISFPISMPRSVQAFNKGMADSPKPKVMVALGDTWQLGPDVMEAVKRKPGGVLALVGPHVAGDRALYPLRPLARAHARAAKPAPFHGHAQARQGHAAGMAGQENPRRRRHSACPTASSPARADEAAAVAKRIGYPVVLKAQAAALSHKTEAGGVMLNLADEAALRAAWDTMQQNIKRAAPDVTLDGCLVEKMSPKGLELMIGAKRDPAWGAVLLLGPRRHLGRGAGRRAAPAGRRRRAADRRGAAQAALGEAARRLPRRAAGRRRGGGARP